MIGDTAVGKTTLMNQYMSKVAIKNLTPTIGFEMSIRILTLDNGVTVKAHIWDTAGQEKYRSMTSTFDLSFLLLLVFLLTPRKRHYRNAVGALVIYDITTRATFEGIIKWVKELKTHADPNIVIMLVGNKLDLAEANPKARQVTREEGENFAKSQHLLFEEVSGYNGTNVDSAFERLINGTILGG